MVRSARALIAILTLAAGAGLASGTSAASASTGYVADPAGDVDPLIGTTGEVNSFPGADAPFGMIQWSPDTPKRPPGGGYDYTDSSITGFSLTHLSGPGCDIYGDVPILPTTGSIGPSPGSASATFSHSDEHATASRYRVKLGSGITADLAAAQRSGVGSFTFPGTKQANLLFELTGGAEKDTAVSAHIIGDREVAGSVSSGHFCDGPDTYKVYFDVKFDRPFSGRGTWQDSTTKAGSRSMTTKAKTKATTATPGPAPSPSGTRHGKATGSTPAPRYHGAAPKHASTKAAAATSSGAYVTFDASSNHRVRAKVGISYVNTAGARRNIRASARGWNVGSVAAATHRAWNAALRRIRIGGGTAARRRIFYTALYHSLLHPNVVSDADGRYRGFDGKVHSVPRGHAQYANYSGWDIYRSQVQLLALLQPRRTNDIVTSMLNDYRQGGELPKWSTAGGEAYIMVGDPADPIIAGAYAFGARRFDTKAALAAMAHQATKGSTDRPGNHYLNKPGYLPVDGTYGCCNFYGPVSTQLEYASADFSVGAFAHALGRSGTARRLMSRAQDWQNTFDAGSAFMRGRRADGSFAPGFDPTSTNHFVEGNSWQYTPMVPFDLRGLINAEGGNAAWQKYLDGFFAELNAGENAPHAWAGNEPGLEAPWEYDYAGAPYKTQRVVRRIQDQLYTDAPAGEAGNDDLGAMSSWYVWSALGMYPETPGTADLALGSPVFPRARVALAGGQAITISAPNAADDAPYVHGMSVNGRTWRHAYLPPSTVRRGARIGVTLGSSPDTHWASGRDGAPPSYATGQHDVIPFTDPAGTVVVAPGRHTTLRLGVRGVGSGTHRVRWHASAAGGVKVSPAGGHLTAGPGKAATTEVHVAAGTKLGSHPVRFHFTDPSGKKIPTLAVDVAVAKPGQLWPYYNNTGVSDDGKAGTADFDGDGWSYSAQALAAAGAKPAGTVTADGFHYTWPDASPGQPDNIQAAGQKIPIAPRAGGQRLGLLGSATNATPGTQAAVTIGYADGSADRVKAGLSDWTLHAGADEPSFGNTIALTTPYRNDDQRDDVTTYVFSAAAKLDPSKTVTSISLPSTVDQGQFHVFAIAVE